jgi:hypothetical protein
VYASGCDTPADFFNEKRSKIIKFKIFENNAFTAEALFEQLFSIRIEFYFSCEVKVQVFGTTG